MLKDGANVCAPLKGEMMEKGKKKRTREEGRPTGFRGYRFDNRIWDPFEERCAMHLSNPRAVIEALLLEWLNSDEAWRMEIAKKYHDWEKTQSAS